MREFDEKFVKSTEPELVVARTESLKSFISSRLILQRKEMRDMVEKMPTEFPDTENDWYDSGAKRFKGDLLNIINSDWGFEMVDCRRMP